MANTKLGATSPHLQLQPKMPTDVVSVTVHRRDAEEWDGREGVLGKVVCLLAFTSWPCPGQPQPPWLCARSLHPPGTAWA